jgi:type IV pilus assembly protein PilO
MKGSGLLQRVRITAKHWHYAGVAVLVLVNLVLGMRLLFAWERVRAGDAARLQQHEIEYRAMQLKTRPLRGLDKKIILAREQEQEFYQQRFPDSYSEVLTELGKLAVANNVLLTRVQYAQGKLDQGAYEVRMDAVLSGDYVPIVRFINDLERDKIFFLIDGIALSGQQGGIVSLRLRLTTFLREAASGQAAAVSGAAAPSARGAQ